MKIKKIIIALVTSIVLLACNKEKGANGKNDANDMGKSRQARVDGSINDNSEVSRILDDIDNPAYTVAIIDNPNYGKFSSTAGYDVIMSGTSPQNVTIALNGVVYRPKEKGQWLQQDERLKQYYGKNVAISIGVGTSKEDFNIYVPQPALVKKLGEPRSMKIKRTGNELEWTPDLKNPSGKVSLVYELYEQADQDETDDASIMYKSDAILLDDKGQFKLDEILSDTRCKKIYFRLVSGNTASTQKIDGKLLFHISTYDQHEYIIAD